MVRGAILAVPVAILVVVILGAWLVPPDGAPVGGAPVLLEDGSRLPFAGQPNVTKATWDHHELLVFTVPAAQLEAVEQARGAGSATPSIAVPGYPYLRMFALSATSAHRGCDVGWMANLGASRDIADYDGDGMKDGLILDKCHHGHWDAFHRGEPWTGTPAPARLAALELRVIEGRLVGLGFDGPIGPQR